MKICRIETITYARQPNILWVRVQTDDGIVGLGETYYLPSAVQAVVHDLAASFLLGQSPFDIEKSLGTIYSRINNFGHGGAEMRAISALDVALWDVIGQATGQPIYNLLGGRCREQISVYNTCVNAGDYADADAFWDQPERLAEELLSQGIKAMKIWPWDRFAPSVTGNVGLGPAGKSVLGLTGSYISSCQIREGLSVVERIRQAASSGMEILIEGHGRWDLNCAMRIARALEPYDVLWIEDMIKPENPADLARLSRSARVPVCVSERLLTRHAYREVLERGAAQVVMTDVVWTGGLTEARKIASLAETYHLPITPHDCTGLVTLFANLHLCASCPNAMMLETVRGFYRGWYEEVYTENIIIKDGLATFPERPGLGTALREDLTQKPGVSVRVSAV